MGAVRPSTRVPARSVVSSGLEPLPPGWNGCRPTARLSTPRRTPLFNQAGDGLFVAIDSQATALRSRAPPLLEAEDAAVAIASPHGHADDHSADHKRCNRSAACRRVPPRAVDRGPHGAAARPSRNGVTPARPEGQQPPQRPAELGVHTWALRDSNPRLPPYLWAAGGVKGSPLGVRWCRWCWRGATARSRCQRRPVGSSRRDRSETEAVDAGEGCRRLGHQQRLVSAWWVHLVVVGSGAVGWLVCERPALPGCTKRAGVRRRDGRLGASQRVRPAHSCEAVQQPSGCWHAGGRRERPQVIGRVGSTHASPASQAAGSQAWSPRARSVWCARRASLRATEMTARCPSARALTAR